MGPNPIWLISLEGPRKHRRSHAKMPHEATGKMAVEEAGVMLSQARECLGLLETVKGKAESSP